VHLGDYCEGGRGVAVGEAVEVDHAEVKAAGAELGRCGRQ
jgi:hypothetical protein